MHCASARYRANEYLEEAPWTSLGADHSCRSESSCCLGFSLFQLFITAVPVLRGWRVLNMI